MDGHESSDSLATGKTLFDLLKDHDGPNDEAWARFERKYKPVIYSWCKSGRLQDADADDLTQKVINRLWLKLQTYQPNPDKRGHFRAWFRTVAGHLVHDYWRERKRAGVVGNSAVDLLIQNQEARESFTRELDRAFVAETMEAALRLLRVELGARDWAIFEARDSRPAEEVAAEHGMKVSALYVSRNRAKKTLREIIEKHFPELAEMFSPPQAPGDGSTADEPESV